ncbi:FadD3 family acyl-CoA ligase [Marinobacterium aestuariivivens]|uniref:FadD3 family acyl-CoA ligase n=1 Tax=Marinobacterium aestuariivivens TaxID=1698799 RepID=A0ABW2A3Q9_9GAMM
MEAKATMPQTLPRLIETSASRYGDHPAIEEGATRLSYRGLARACREAARALLGLGIAPGDRIAIWAPNIHEWILAAAATQSVGAVLVPLNTRMKGAEAGYVLRRSGARGLFCIGDFLGADYPGMLAGEELPALEWRVILRGEPAAGGDLGWSAFLARGEGVTETDVEARAADVQPDDTADLLFTSGTTGKPKGVMCSHRQNLTAVGDWSAIVGLRADDRYLIVNPFFHSFGYKAGWLAALIRGATILPHPVFDVPAILERVETERISVLPGPPTLYQSILAHPARHDHDLSSLRIAVTGATAIPVEMIHRMDRELGFEIIVTAYGLTETCGFVSITRQGDGAERIATTSGRAFPGIEVRCVDADGREVRRGEPGEVVVRGYSVMQGYFEDPEATAEAIDGDGWLHTGDVAVMDADGYLRITDRMKDMFITGGFNCYPAEIENLMAAHEAIAQVAVVGAPDERLGEVAMAFVVSVAGAAIDEAGLIAWCRERMANYKVPRRIAFVSSLPLNASGKVQKFELRRRAAGTAV